MNKVILDCDNTMGVKRSDIDDGLTFAYLYTHEDVEVLGMTCTFANNHEHVCYYNSVQMMEDLGVKDVPVFAGGRKPGEYDNAAVDFLVKTVDENPGEIVVIAIGSMNNLGGAYHKDKDFFKKVKEVVVMGGMLEVLYLNKALCNELNFTVAPNEACDVMFECGKLTLLSSQCTRLAEYPQEEIAKVKAIGTPFIEYLTPIIDAWVKYIGPAYGDNQSFINWDLCTAIYVTNPELFDRRALRVVKNPEPMKKGFLEIDYDGKEKDENVNIVNIPSTIYDLEKFNELFYNELKKMKMQ